MPYERDIVQRLAPYTPGEQPQRGRVVKLNTNENPYAPAEPVMQAIRSLPAEMLRRYPSPRAEAFRKVAAEAHGLASEQVIATNGGDELLRMAMTVFAQPRSGANATGGIGVAEPSYSLYPVLADIHDTPVTRVPLRDDFSLPDDFAPRLLNAGCRLVLVVNPHAPSGRLESVDTLARLADQLRGRAVLLVDEAYTNFAGHDALPLVRDTQRFDNVLLLRTLSKGYSLAGLRFGYGLGHPAIIAALDKVRDSYNTDALSQAAACAALQHRDLAAQTWQKVIDERARVTAELRRRGYTVPDSQSNFILATPPAGHDAAAIYRTLKGRGVFVRYFDQDRLRDKLRITIGTPQENDVLLAELDEIK